MRIRRVAVLTAALLGAVALGACSGDSGSRVSSTSSTVAKADVRARCARPSASRKLGGRNTIGDEIEGASRNGSLWGLALGPAHLPLRAGDELKIVWRLTGTGPLSVVFSAPDGEGRSLVFGPDARLGSSWTRPGDEWGTGFKFDAAGCWHIHLARTDVSGDVWLDVSV
jgi:hypothetical protein